MSDATRWIVVDLEATCWVPEEDPALAADQRNETEVIEIGAVRVDPATWSVGASFRTLVEPRRHPRLSAFCTRLTGITQDELRGAPSFPDAYAAFVDWAGGDRGMILASWGVWDDRQLRRDAKRYELPPPRWQAVNVKRQFARFARDVLPRGGWIGLHQAC
ncbi:MAG: 3'-5' exonuclease, partial [Myxococcota bacterium]